MTDAQFLNAVALGQVTPGPVVHTVAVVGYAAAGSAAALLAAAVAFAPSFAFILIGAERFDRLRANRRVRAFLDGAGPAAIGAIAGAAIPLALALTEPWQVAVLAAGGACCCSRCGAGGRRRCSPPARRGGARIAGYSSPRRRVGCLPCRRTSKESGCTSRSPATGSHCC